MKGRVGAAQKQKALQYFQSVACEYETQISRGPLKQLRSLERSAVCDLVFGSMGSLTGKSFLDVGCGSGFYSREAKRRGMHVTSIDAVPEMIDAIDESVDVARVDDVERSLLGSSFDRVLCAGVLDFVVDPERAFSNLARWTAEGGQMVLLLPHSGWGGKIYQLEKSFFGIQVNLFSEEWVRGLAAGEGLKVVEIKSPLPTNRVYRLVRPLVPKLQSCP